MKKQKGFTLIELLAIIVILAIIAVITVPIILNVIDNAKRGTAKDSAYGYKDAINKYYVSGMLEDESIKLSGDYNVIDGKLGEYDIPFSGTKPTSGFLTFENNALTSGCLTIDEYKVTFSNGEVSEVEVGECGSKVYKCKRADVSKLHTEECKNTCQGSGIANGELITYGNTEVTQGTLTSGDAFDCDVNGDGEYTETERFYYVSDLYNTTSKEFDSNYAVLIYYNNFANENPDNTSSNLIAYHSENKNYNGPAKAVTNMPTTALWKNVSLSNTSRSILNENAEGTSNENSNILPTSFSYEGYAARLLTVQEINSACNIKIGQELSGEIDKCNYLMQNTAYSNSSLMIWGYWLENPISKNDSGAWGIHVGPRAIKYLSSNDASYYATRPAIEVLKSEIQY